VIKLETVLRAITRAGLDPFEFIIYPSSFGQPVIIELRSDVNQDGKINHMPAASDSSSTLIIHPDDGIKRITAQIKEKFLYH